MPVTPANRFITRVQDADDASTALGIARTLFVDASNGSASGSRGRSDLAFSTYALALAAWLPGDTIHMRPGRYTAAMALPSYTRTIAAASTGLVRVSSTVTCTVTVAHAIPVGTRIYVSGATSSTFDGVFIVASVPSTTTLTWKQFADDATSGGGSLTAAGYIRMDDGAVVDVTHASVSNAVATLYGTSKTFTVVTGGGEFHGRNGYCVSLSTTTDSRLEIACREIAAWNADGAAGLFAGGARTAIVANVSNRIMSERYDGIWIDGAAAAYVKARFIEGGDDGVELTTTQGCQIEAEEITSYHDRWATIGSGFDTSALDLSNPVAGQTHVIRAGLVRTVGSIETGGKHNGLRIQITGGTGAILYDVRRTVSHGGPCIWIGGGSASLVNGQFVSTYTGTGDPESGDSGYALYAEGGVMRFMGECHLIASSAVTTSTFSFSAIEIAGPCRINKASHAEVTLPNSTLDPALV